MTDPRLLPLAADEAARLIARLLDGGYLRLYPGARPESGTPESDWLAEVPLGSPAFQDPTDGVAELYPAQAKAAFGGTAVWYSAVAADGTPVLDGAVGGSLVLNSAEIVAGAEVSITGFRVGLR